MSSAALQLRDGHEAGGDAAPRSSDVPLCVDLDGTLTPVDSLHESLLSLVRQSPRALPGLPSWLGRGKAGFKGEVAARVQFDAQSLPYREPLLNWLRAERASGRRLVLATAAHRSVAEEVARHLQLFDEVVASDAKHNLSGENKRRALAERFGEKGYDYVGNAPADEAVWKSARKAVVVGAEPLVQRAQRVSEVSQVFAVERPRAVAWLKAMRLHQWIKNVLVFVPALLAHRILDARVLSECLLAFLAFGLCASSVYLVNDLLDLSADRRHPRKRSRPFAAGTLSARSGLLAAGLLLAATMAVAAAVNLAFCAALTGYYVTTWAYSLRLKHAAPVDVMTLAGLYTLRIVAGAAAASVALSFWLLAFSVFLFLSLGIVKRYAELDGARQAGKTGSFGRRYSATDLSVLMSLGTSAGYCAIIVMALYLNSAESQALYRHTQPLWLICPLMLYWISRVWLLTARGQMHDDPIVFALRDRISLVVAGLMAAALLLAI